MHTHDLTAYLLDELSPEEHSAVERALAESPELRAELEEIRATHEAIAAHLAAETGPEPAANNVVDFKIHDKVTPFREILVFLGTPAGFGALAACATLATAIVLFAPDNRADRTMRAEVTESAATVKTVETIQFEVKKTRDAADADALRNRIARERLVYTAPAEVVIKRSSSASSAVQTPAFAEGLTSGSMAKGTNGGTVGGTDIGKSGGKNIVSNYGSAPSGLSVRAKVDFESDYIFRGKEHSDANVQTKIASGATRSSPREVETGVISAALGRRAAAPASHVGDSMPYPEQREYARRTGGTGDRFDAGVTEQAFVKAAESPLSTFSVDVNTASYAYARRMFSEGSQPPARSVRAEEWLNNFAYDYPAPTGVHPISVYTEGSECPWNTEHKIVRVGLRAANVSQENRPPANLVFLVDTSGSMGPQDRLPLAKEALLKLLDRLDERDRVGIVTYAGTSGVAAEPTACDREGKKKLESVILALGSGGSTNGAAGLRDAYELASRNLNAKGVNRVVLATDGDFNVGLSGTSEIVDLAKREAGKKVFLTVLGFGTGNLNADLMKQLSVKADGNHFYIDSLKEADRVLSKKLAGTLITVARDVKIQIDFNPSRVAAYRLIGYDTRRLANEDFNDDKKDAGEMGAGHTVTALYEIVPVGATPPVDDSRYVAAKPVAEKSAAPASDEWLTVKVRYQPPEGGKSTLIEKPLPSAGMRPLSEASPDQKFAAAVAESALFFRNSAHKGSANVDDAIRLLAQPGVTGEDADRKEFADMLRMARHLGK
jgi:Ca-activated chloride channel family protein